MADGEGRGNQRRRAASYGRRARRQMALIGLAGVALELVVVHAAFGGLHRVDVANQDVRRITQAQRYFQDADQAHDALHADVLQALLEGRDGPALPRDEHGGLQVDAPAFRADLERVTAATLSPALTAAVARIHLQQLRYVDEAEQLAALAHLDPGAARSELEQFNTLFVQLETTQGDVTARLGEEVAAEQVRATRDEHAARWRITAASLAGLVGLLGLTWLLNRLGRALATLAARERGVAETLQHSLLPAQLPCLPGLPFGSRYVPGGAGTQVGGDWYDVVPLRTGEVGLVMGDVAGHDLQAAAAMGALRNSLRAYAAEGLPPGEVLDRLNRLSMAHSPGEMATCLYAVLDPVAATLSVANAGHYAPLLVDPDGAVRTLQQGVCPPIGAVREARYPTVVHQVPPGSTLVMFTDGLVERRGVPIAEGLRALETLLMVPADDLDTLCDRVLGGLLGDEPPSDDVALLVVRPSARLGHHLDMTWPAQPTSLVELRRTLERWLAEVGADDAESYEVVVACTEAATNAIEHAYGPGQAQFGVRCDADPHSRTVTLVVRDEGKWRSARGRDRGRGLQLVRGLMDDVLVLHDDSGTQVHMSRRLSGPQPVRTAVPQQEQVSA